MRHGRRNMRGSGQESPAFRAIRTLVSKLRTTGRKASFLQPIYSGRQTIFFSESTKPVTAHEEPQKSISFSVLGRPRRPKIGACSKATSVAFCSRDCHPRVFGRRTRCSGCWSRGKVSQSPTLDCELADIETWCASGNYFAAKLRGGVALAIARANGDAEQHRLAVAELEKARGHWKRLAELTEKFNQLPVPSKWRQPFSWTLLIPDVEKDIEIAKAPLASMK